MALFKFNLTHEDAIKSHQSFYSDTFEVLPMRRCGYFDIFPLNVLIAYAGVNGGGEWDGIISTDGKKIVIKSNFSLFDLLKKYKLVNKKVAIEHNGTIIPKVNYKKKSLKNNDKVEIVHFIGGG